MLLSPASLLFRQLSIPKRPTHRHYHSLTQACSTAVAVARIFHCLEHLLHQRYVVTSILCAFKSTETEKMSVWI